MSNFKPLVSVIMNCHNGEKYLEESINSVVSQTYSNWELIFWDNQSTDNSKTIFEKYSRFDNRLKYFCSKEFTSLGTARNKAIACSSGDFLAFLDCDDIWFNQKLEYQIPKFNDKNVGVVICDTLFFNDSNKCKQYYKRNKPPTGRVFKQLIGGYFISLETVVLRKKALDSLDHFFDPRFSMLEECDLLTRICYEWELDFVDMVLAKWRVHGGSLTWSRREWFIQERKMMLDKFTDLFPDFTENYSDRIQLVHRRNALDQSLIYWEKKENTLARLCLKEYCLDGISWFLFYLSTFLPFSVYKLLSKVRGSVLPI